MELNNEYEGKKLPFDCETLLNECQVDPLKDIDEPPTILEIYSSNGKKSPVCTLGNFSLLIGKTKSRKTFLQTAIIAALATNKPQLDRLAGCMPDDKNIVLLFDTEQSEYHLSRTVKRACRLSGVPNPSNFRAFGLRPFTPAERVKLIEFAIENTPNLGFVAIDGLRDLVSSINDEAQATEIISHLLKWTAIYNIHIMLVLHQNKNDANARGWIGSEAVNKGETVLSVSLATDKESSIVECEFSRDLPFDSFAFQINENGLPEACDLPEKANTATKCYPDLISEAIHFEVLKDTYKTEKEPNYNQLMDSIVANFGSRKTRFGQSKCRSFIAYYLDQGWIEKIQSGRNVIYKYNRALF